MNSKRNISLEISDLKSRTKGRSKEAKLVFARLDQLVTLLETTNLNSALDQFVGNEIRKHLCISIIALFQSQVRGAIIDIINFKEQAGETIPELNDAKITLSIARELKNSKFTLGELVAHFLPTTSLEHASNSIKHVSGEGLISIIKRNLTFDPTNTPWKNMDELIAAIISYLNKLVIHRNIIAHEEALDYQIPVLDVTRGLRVMSYVVTGLNIYRETLSSKAEPSAAANP